MPRTTEKGISTTKSRSSSSKKVRVKSKSKRNASDEAMALALRAIIQATGNKGDSKTSSTESAKPNSSSHRRSSSKSRRRHDDDYEASEDSTCTEEQPIDDYHKMQRVMLDRIDQLEGKIFMMKNFTEEVHRSVLDVQRGFEERLVALETSLKAEIEEERNKRLKLIRSVHKLDEEEMNKTRAKIGVVQEDTERRLRDQDATLRSATEEIARLKGLVDDLVSNNSVSDDKGCSEAEKALELRIRRIERHMGMTPEARSPSPRRISASKSSNESADKLVGGLSLRLEGLERTVASLSRAGSSPATSTSAALESAIKETKDELKLMGKNTSKACRALSGGLADVQHATLLLYSWADKVYKSFETISYKLEYPMNICPRVRIDLANHPGSFNQISEEFDIRLK